MQGRLRPGRDRGGIRVLAGSVSGPVLRVSSTLWRRWPLALESVAYLAAASLAKRYVPPRRTARLLGRPTPPEQLRAAPPGPEAMLVGRAVTRVARRLPWHPACLPQAVATRAMLRRRGIECVSHVGVVGTEPFEAHAWVTVNGCVVQGGPVTDATELARFT